MSLEDEESDDGSSTYWQTELQSHRLEIAGQVEYKRISPWLKAYYIFDQEDDEEISNQYLHPTPMRQIDRMVDKLLRKGEENYNKFLEILGFHYPDVYTSITKREAPKQPSCKPPDVIPFPPFGDTKDEVLTILMERFDKKKLECEDLAKQNMVMNRDLEDKTREISTLQTQIQEQNRRNERYESMERDMAALKDIVDQVKNENYKVCMRLVDINEENSRLRERNMAMRIENDKAKVDLRKMETTVNSERSVSIRLRRTLATGPSEKVIRSLQQEIDQLKLKLAQSNHTTVTTDNDVDTRIQILQSDKEEAIQMYAEATEKLNKLREDFNNTEALRDKYLEENEKLRLEFSKLSDDCEMYKTRRDAVWQQLQEVEKERDQLMKERNESQMIAQNHMEEKTKYRAEIRKLEEMQDQLSYKLREKETLLRERQKSKPVPRLPDEEVAETLSNSPEETSTATDHSPSTDDTQWQCTRPRAHNTKYYAEFSVKSEFDATIDAKNNRIGPDGIFPEIPLAPNYGEGCGKITVASDCPRHRKLGVRKKNINSGSATRKRNSESQSRTSSTDSEYQRKLDESSMTLVEIDAKTVQDCVRLIGGNNSGIFINQIAETCPNSQYASMLQPGMQLLKIRQPPKKGHVVNQWTLEFAYNVIRSRLIIAK